MTSTLFEQVAFRSEPAIVRLEQKVRLRVAVLTGRLPYITLLLRARGHPAGRGRRR